MLHSRRNSQLFSFGTNARAGFILSLYLFISWDWSVSIKGYIRHVQFMTDFISSTLHKKLCSCVSSYMTTERGWIERFFFRPTRSGRWAVGWRWLFYGGFYMSLSKKTAVTIFYWLIRDDCLGKVLVIRGSTE